MSGKLSAWVGIAALLVAGILLNGVLTGPAPAPVDAAPDPVSPQEVKELAEFATKLEKLFQHAADKVGPAVVSIQTTQVIRSERSPFGFNDPFFDEFLRRRFPDFDRYFRMPEREQRRQGLGSGMILDRQGHILTNRHVVEKADELEVKLADGRTFEAEVTGTDDKTDLAVIKLKGDFEDLPTVELGDSSKLEIGQWVLAVGSPFGLTHTVSAGIISAKGRSGIGVAEYESLIQTDAAINPGNSGGPLVNLQGQVVGINTAILSPSRGYMGNVGIGFAIPVNMASSILEELKTGAEIRRGYLGVRISDLTPGMAETFGFGSTNGVLIHEVEEGTPAEEAGLEHGDIVVKYDGRKVNNANQFRQMAAATEPGEKVEITVWRKGEEKTLTVRVGELGAELGSADWFGVAVQNITREKAEKLRLRTTRGVEVTNVSPDSPAARVLSRGDMIFSVNRKPVADVDEYREIMGELKDANKVILRILDIETGRSAYVEIPVR